jgi:hypothetical protein
MCGNNAPWYYFHEAILECVRFWFGRGSGPLTAAHPIKTKMPGTPSGPLSKKKKAALAAEARAAKKLKSQPSDDDDDDDNSKEEETDVVQATVVDGDGAGDNQEIGEEAVTGETAEQPEKWALQKTKYMSSRVRGETTGTVFRAVKFLNTPKLVDTTLEKLATLFNVTPESRASWKLLYQKEMIYALNNKRNSVYQDMKPKIQGKSENCLNHSILQLSHNVVPFAELLDANPSWELLDFVDVRSDPEGKKGFFEFFDIVVSAVCGRRSWTNEMKTRQTITESGKVTISDEAFAELLIKNYWERWKSNGAAKWTDARSVNVNQHGWSKEGHVEFNRIYLRIKAQRENTGVRNTVEALLMKKAREVHTPNRSKRTVGGVIGGDDEVMVDDW